MSPALLIKDVRIFDGEDEIPSGSVLVENGLIKQVSEGSLDVSDPSTIVISKPGHTLFPGLIDSHCHAFIDEQNTTLGQSLKFGVTTLCELHHEVHNMDWFRSRAATDPDSADFKTSGLSATVAGGWPAAVIMAVHEPENAKDIMTGWADLQTKADVETYIQDRIRDKVDFIKLMHEDGNGLTVKPVVPPLEIQKTIVDLAHQHGFLTIAHALSYQGTIDILRTGVDGMTHTFVDKPITQEVIDAYKINNAHCDPTLVTIASLTKDGREEQEKYAHDPRVTKLLNSESQEHLCKCIGLANENSRAEYAYESVRQLKAAGIDIILGSDSAGAALGTAFGFSAHHEIATFVRKCGFTPAEALKSGTSLVAKRFRLNDRGRIAPGFRADLVLVEGNPLEDIDHTLDLRGVWKQGTLISAYKDLVA
ncbi:uncharacterized protein F4822DRAFT_432796 [Hypoxylon trugodes]|uniref:uncharacterized protein n=1 Tax=Hypoxylon trugodes TaxID=326681 RepID=UPI0021981DE1|nr:uncharacterized protein F4822DRAFT_432796 [Hypoxylon trugodes]KAI1385938.1 hypothetical protein F4822DRAFT_432796 [Hypoxylon trugodes]